MARVTLGRGDPAMARVLVGDSAATLRWMRDRGIRFRLMHERQAYEDADGRRTFSGGLAVGVVDGGRGTGRPARRGGRATGDRGPPRVRGRGARARRRDRPPVKDGLRTHGRAVEKTNWALAIDTPPYVAIPVTCGITFTFGGLFFHNYPGGSGLTAGAVYGRRAGYAAAALTLSA